MTKSNETRKPVKTIYAKTPKAWGKRLLPRFGRNVLGQKMQLHATKGWRKL